MYINSINMNNKNYKLTFKGTQKSFSEITTNPITQTSESVPQLSQNYGQALVKPYNNIKKVIAYKIDKAIERFNTELQADEQRKQDFIKLLRQEKQTLLTSDDVRSAYDDSGIKNVIKEENFTAAQKLFDEKISYRHYRFDAETIYKILGAVNKDNIDLLDKIMHAKEKNGYYRFEEDEICSLISAVNADSRKVFDILYKEKFSDHRYRFDGKQMTDILKAVNSENKDMFPDLLTLRNETQNYRFNDGELAGAYKHLNPKNFEIFKKVLEIREKNNTFRFSAKQAGFIVKNVTPDNEDVLNQLLNEKAVNGQNRFKLTKNPEALVIGCIMSTVTKDNRDALNKLLSAKDEQGNDRFIGENIYNIMRAYTPDNKKVLNYLLSDVYKDGTYRYNTGNIVKFLEILNNGSKTTFETAKKNLDSQKDLIINSPQMYFNEKEDPEKVKTEIEDFFYENYQNLLVLALIYDKETLNSIMKMGLMEVKNCLNKINSFNADSTILLSQLVSSKDKDGNPFDDKQKIDFINILQICLLNKISQDNITKMAQAGTIDVEQLNVDYMKGILKKCGLSKKETDEIPREILLSWNYDYAYLLSNEMQNRNDVVLSDIVKASAGNDFFNFILDESTKYGQVNQKTGAEFSLNGLNYSAWLKPSKDNIVHFSAYDKNDELLKQISLHVIENIQALRQTTAKHFVDNKLSNYIKADRFTLPVEYTEDKEKLKKFLQNFLEQTQVVYKHAGVSIDNTKYCIDARNILTSIDCLNNYLKDLTEMPGNSNTNKLDITVKMWDRIPQKDLFQGNYTQSGMEIGRGNGASPRYLVNTMFNMIELIDNTTGKTVGNSLCYFVKDENNQPALVLDKIKIKSSHKPSSKTGIELRNAIVEYASNVAEEVTGKTNTPIYIAEKGNDVPFNDHYKKSKKLNVLGHSGLKRTYMNLFGGWGDKSCQNLPVYLYQVK